jgi:DNA-binding LacI/PurR family transcriptional regulator
MEPDDIPPRISMREIGARLGVSHATVSMAMRDSPRVSAAMREKVKRTAEELGYRPDPMLNALAAYRSSKSTPGIHSAVAWINAWEQPEELRSYREFDLYWKGARECAVKFGYRLEEFRLNRQLNAERLHQIFQTRNIRGILLPPHRTQPEWKNFPWEKYSIARFGRTLRLPASHMVTADQFANTYLAVGKMRERGYGRIGFISQRAGKDPRGPHFRAGFLSAREELSDEAPLLMFCHEGSITKNLVTRFRAWMRKEKPDALLCTDNPAELLHEAGYRVPEDIAVAVTSVLDGGADSGVDQHPEEIGRAGMLLLNSLISEGARGIPAIFRQILVQGSWVDGTSLPDRRLRSQRARAVGPASGRPR